MNIYKKFFKITIFSLLIFSFISFAAYGAGKSKLPIQIIFPAKDEFKLSGFLDIPQKASIKNKVPLVIFVHSIGRSSVAWMNFPDKVKGLGVATLNLDLRGHGLSIKDKNDKVKYWTYFNNKEFQKMPDDINSAITYIKTQYPEINTGKTAIIAASLGANASIIAGSHNNRSIKSLVLLSPTIEYKGLETRIPLVGFGPHPVLMMASNQDRFAYYAATDLIKYAQGKKQLKVYPSGGNGISLIKTKPESQKFIIDWLKANYLGSK